MTAPEAHIGLWPVAARRAARGNDDGFGVIAA